VIHSLFLEVEKRKGNEPPVSVGTAEWSAPSFPTRIDFVEDVEYLYGLIEPPYHVHRAYSVVRTDLDVLVVESDWPLDPPARVGQELWDRILSLPDVA